MKSSKAWFSDLSTQSTVQTVPRLPSLIRSGPRADGGTMNERNPASQNTHLVVGETPITGKEVVGR